MRELRKQNATVKLALFNESSTKVKKDPAAKRSEAKSTSCRSRPMINGPNWSKPTKIRQKPLRPYQIRRKMPTYHRSGWGAGKFILS